MSKQEWWTCKRKIGYTKKQAEIEILKRGKGINKGAGMYGCEYCGKYHVTMRAHLFAKLSNSSPKAQSKSNNKEDL